MGQYRKRPVVIEATQWFKEGDHPAVRMSYPWGDVSRPKVPVIDTLEGVMSVEPGDWIVTGVKGEHYPCKPDIFAETYEPVLEAFVQFADGRALFGAQAEAAMAYAAPERHPVAAEADRIVADVEEAPWPGWLSYPLRYEPPRRHPIAAEADRIDAESWGAVRRMLVWPHRGTVR